MQRLRWLIVLVLATLGGVRCSETPSDPSVTPSNTMPALIVSEALAPNPGEAAASAGSAIPVAFVSLPPGTLASIVSVRIRNLTTGGGATTPVPIVEGGFDPVAVRASAGDRLALSFTDAHGGVTEEYATVPARRLPVVVRTAPTKGRTDVALSVRPVVVFSEPIDPATLPVGMRLVTDGTLVSGRIEMVEPWIAQFIPESPLEPGTGYELELTQEIRGVDGLELETSVTAGFTTGAQPPAPPSPLSGVLALTDFGDIHVMDLSAQTSRRLTFDGPVDAHNTQAAWSPDGSRIAFTRFSGDYIQEIYVIDAEGGIPQRVSPRGTYDAFPTWSPDGRRIAFEHRPDSVSGGQIYVMNTDGTNRVQLTTDFQPVWGPSWSPADERIAFVASNEAGNLDIYVMNADGTQRVNLTNDAAFDIDPAWSPDGKSVVFSRDGGDLFVVDADGTSLRQLTKGLWAAQPAWSPDGSTVAFALYVDCDNPWTCPGPFLWTVRLSDGLLGQLPVMGVNGMEPSWRP